MKDFVDSGATPVTILKEFLTCRDSSVTAKAGTSILPNQVLTMGMFGGPASFGVNELIQFIGPSAIERTTCTVDNHDVKRPSYINASIDNLCQDVHSHDLRCQRDDFKFPSDPKVHLVEGDLALDSLPAGTQWLTSTLYNNSSTKLLPEPEQTQLNDWAMALDAKRNQNLIELTKTALSKNRVILPWGSDHMDNLGHQLEEAGFRLAETKRILYIPATSKMSKLGVYKYLNKTRPSCPVPTRQMSFGDASVTK